MLLGCVLEGTAILLIVVPVFIGYRRRDPRMTTVLIGASSVGQLEQNVAALDNLAFNDDELWAIDEHAIDSGIDLWEAPRTA